ncbi:MAG TPA: ribonuclease HII [archaeon]|nr:ribonuclease HII [archaeon]
MICFLATDDLARRLFLAAGVRQLSSLPRDMNLKGLSITAVRSLIARMESVPDELLADLANDPRNGVRALGEEIERKQARQDAERLEQEKMLELERTYHARGLEKVAGVDEVGRGPLAGPVMAAAVIFPPECDHPQARDSKKLTPEKREALYAEIHDKALAIGIGRADNEEIDRLNIYNASLVAMYRAVENLQIKPDAVLVDGPMVLRLEVPQNAVIGGDARCLSLAAASIVAKVTRDRLMKEFDRVYPGYGFARHKGYPTSDHFKALKEFGPCPIHRRSFTAVANCGEFPNQEWSFFYDGLSQASSLEELEVIAGGIRQIRHIFTRAELESLRRTYRRRRKSLEKL